MITLVAAEAIDFKRMVSFKFIHESGVPRKWVNEHATPNLSYGILCLMPEGSDYYTPVNPIQPTVLAWSVFVFEEHHGQTFSWGVPKDDTVETLKTLFQEVPDNVILLMLAPHALLVKQAWEQLGRDVRIHEYHGKLSTS